MKIINWHYLVVQVGSGGRGNMWKKQQLTSSSNCNSLVLVAQLLQETQDKFRVFQVFFFQVISLLF